MRKFRYEEPVGDPEVGNITYCWEVRTITEKEIEENYLPYYKTQMAKVGKLEEATLENAIEDFCIIHWAWEVTDEDAPETS